MGLGGDGQMATAIESIMSLIKSLSPREMSELKAVLLGDSDSDVFRFADSPSFSSDMEEYMTNERFSNGMFCLHCGSIHVVRNGHRSDGTQRYLCRDCRKTFVITSNSIASGTRKDLSVWKRYVSCMMQGLSIRKTAEICGIHRNTAFYWRHKILDAVRSEMDGMVLDGIVEMDEAFFPVSYKGNHKRSKRFSMPRESRRRGGQVHVRGLSREQVCVPCAVNRNGKSIAKASNLGRISAKDVHSVFDGRIDGGATIVTDKMNAYVKFANECGNDLVQVKGGKSKRGIYNVQRVNAYHGILKKFMRNFNGVSTKYLDNYLAWNNLVNYGKEADDEKRSLLARIALTAIAREICSGISDRSALPVR